MERTHSVWGHRTWITSGNIRPGSGTLHAWGSCASQGNCAVLGLVILRITFAICSKIGLFLVFLNFHFFAKVWSIKWLAKNLSEMWTHWLKSCEWAVHVETAIKSPCAKRGPLYVCTWRKDLQDNFWLVNPKFASVVHMLSSQSSICIILSDIL
jgi:hypothetical protein